ncbi:hypothetical protein HMPREF0372_01530 [Flavonifractor plautii ATCC 29863]|uniref:Uncharacterized protein n=1 Tax=Flavonifractor plautii ATCC 29863 TaxID=411475 RepID=G9YPU1_FLAPL|nr:hypothetical protein HMPREF0372_01530 [Flavonifractor plautii ATCC 29863]
MGEKGVARPSLELGSGLYRRAIQTQKTHPSHNLLTPVNDRR